MKNIFVHDYAGHPFQVQLSRHLASRFDGNVTHAYCASTLTPQADLLRKASDVDGFNVLPLALGRTIQKYRFFSRFMSEVKYGRILEETCSKIKPDVILSANTPTLAQYRLTKWAKRNKVRCVTWVQDMYGVAAYRILKRKIPVLGGIVGQALIHLDRLAYRSSDVVVPITEDFVPHIEKYGVAPSRIETVHNWAPLESLPLVSRDNEWALAQFLYEGTRFIYSGTLSIRHNPELLLRLSQALSESGMGSLLVISEGNAAEWLKAKAKELGLDCLKSLSFQPLALLPTIMGSADVLISILEEESGVFCVPSKVLTYMCAGKPILSAMPAANLATRLIIQNNLGCNCSPHDVRGFVENGILLAKNPELRARMGLNARRYAEQYFRIGAIADRFAAILNVNLSKQF